MYLLFCVYVLSLSLSLSLILPILLTYTHPSGIPAPAASKLTIDDVYLNGKPQPDVLKQHFIKEGRIEEDVALRIINECEY